ncbi:MAG: DUF6541 family protein [Candidatus Altiarchaeota archaeon]
MASLLMVAAAIAFNLYITLPLMSFGLNDAGDDGYHISQAYYLKKMIVEDHTIFGVVNAQGAGYPWNNNHQFLMYLTEALINIISFDRISLIFAHKGLLVVFYSFYPAGVYFLLRKFRQAPLVCGLGALLAPLPISGWGHTTNAYFVIGLSSQAMGAFMFPFALGSFHEALTEGKGQRRAGLLYILTLFAHPYYGFFLCFLSVVDLAIQLARRSMDEMLSIVRNAAYAGVIGLLLGAFWLVPLPTALEYVPRAIHMQTARTAFSPMMEAKAFIGGELLDVSNNFGGPKDKNLRWPVNTGRGRLPILTALTIIGLGYALVRRDRFSIFCLLVFGMSMVLMIGESGLSTLEYLPFADHANPKRFIFVFDLFAVLLSAQALHMILDKSFGFLTRYVNNIAAFAVCGMLLAVVVYTPYNERMLSAKKDVNLISYWLPSFEKIRNAIDSDGLDGRMYGDGETGVNTAPIIFSQSWLLDNPYMRRIYVTRFYGNLMDYPNIFRLFNIRYMLMGAGQKLTDVMEPMTEQLYKDRLYRLYRVDGDFGYLSMNHKKPALVATSEEGWREISETWIRYYKNASNPDHMPLLVQYGGPDVSAEDYSQLILYDRTVEPSVYSGFGNRTLVTTVLNTLVKAAIKDSKKGKVSDSIDVVSHKGQSIRANVESDGGLLVLKYTYHPNWRAYVDGREEKTMQASPEFPAVFLSPGRHEVEFRYEKAPWQKALDMVSALTLLFVLIPSWALDRASSGLMKRLRGRRPPRLPKPGRKRP